MTGRASFLSNSPLYGTNTSQIMPKICPRDGQFWNWLVPYSKIALLYLSFVCFYQTPLVLATFLGVQEVSETLFPAVFVVSRNLSSLTISISSLPGPFHLAAGYSQTLLNIRTLRGSSKVYMLHVSRYLRQKYIYYCTEDLRNKTGH